MYDYYYITPTGNLTISGIATLASKRRIVIVNTSLAFTITLTAYAGSASTPTYRFRPPSNVNYTIPTGGSAKLYYNSNWYVTA